MNTASSLIDLSRLPRPEPSSGIAAYEAERAARLAFDPRTRANWERYLEAQGGARKAAVDYLPVKLDIENVSRCNFACIMCAVSKWPKRRRAADMTLAAFRGLIDEQYGLIEIKLNGLGEALLQGDDYFDMVRYARAKHIWVRTTTNGSLLKVRENYRKLIDSDVNEIDISIDGSTPAIFEKIRVGSNFRIVMDGCEVLNGYCAEKGITRTKMWTLVQRANVMHLEAHVTLAARLGFKHLIFSLQLHGWGDAALAARNAAEQVPLGHERLLWLIEQGREHGVRVSFWDVSAKFDTDRPEHLCPWPFERAVVSSDLRTVPCCMIGDPDAFEIGRGKPFAENWAGEEYRAFRQAHLDGHIPAVCKGCYK